MDPDYGHYFPADTIAEDVSNWCYGERAKGMSSLEFKDYKYFEGNQGYLDSGYFGKFDQFAFADDLILDRG
jgi:hypothetical protein